MSLSSPKNNTARTYKSNKNKSKKKLIKKDSKSLAFEFGKNLYQKNFTNPNPLLLNLIKDENISIILNNISSMDITILNEILKKYYYFQQIEISPFASMKTESGIKKLKMNKETLKENKEKQERLRDKINKIIIGISKHLSLSNNIICLSIINFELYSKYIELISKGISHNKSLQALKISRCLIQLSCYENLIRTLFDHPCISYLDLSNNNFNDKYGTIISKLIIKHSQRRDQIIWSYGLRNEKITSNINMGLISLNLSGNKLGNKSADIISKALGVDQYIRAVYLNDNEIENNSCKKFIYMMRKNLCILTLDLRGNPGYDEFIHSRLVMKMSKNMRYLYQQYKKGEFTEEEFENFKEFIDATFFDVDIPQEIVEFYNNNLPETSEENNIDNNNNENIIKEKKINMNNYIEDEDKKEIILMNRQLSEENLQLKKEIKELKSQNFKNNNNKNNKEKEEYKKTESDIDSYYSRLEELINELNDIMNKIEKKQSKNDNNNNINEININNNNINNNEMIKKEEKIEKTKKEENMLNELLKKANKNEIIIEEEKKAIEENKNIIKNDDSKIIKEKEKKLEPIPYEEVPVEPSEVDKSSDENSHYEDEEGNIYNYDDLTNEEKMLIIQQKLILQKLQEEAEARGEQFNPQEYIEFLERQAMEEEEEEDDDDYKERKGKNKLNKSF